MKTTKPIREDVAVQLILKLEDSSDWLKSLVETGCERDPVDVLKDLERAHVVFSSVVNRIFAANLPAVTVQ